MKAELAAPPPADPEESEGIQSAPGWRQTGVASAKDAEGVAALVAVVFSNIKLLVLGPAIAGLLAFGITSALPKLYTSVAYLNLDENNARAADARMRSVPVLDKVLAGFNAPQSTLEARRRAIEENRRIVVAAGETQKTSKLFRLEYSNEDPRVAQKVNSLLIESWLESTKPPPEKRLAIEAEIERMDLQTKSISQLIERLEKDAPTLISQSLQGELATPILGLITKRDDNLSNLITLRSSLNGVSRDVIFGGPDLPEEPSWPRRGIISILTVAITALLLLLVLLLHRFRPSWI
jgi:hypothetical protein